MQKNRSRRSNISSTPPPPTTSTGKGLVVTRKERKYSKLASDSSSQSSDSTQDSFTSGLGWRSSKQAFGTPIKRLIAEEMSGAVESKRRSPSVVARLMGLDGLLPQQASHKQQLRLAEKKFPQNELSSTPSRHSSGKSSKEEQEFKDVFEVLDSVKMGNCGYSSRGTSSSKYTDAEMAFIKQKFMDAKRLSTDENLQRSKEFDGTLEDLNSNKDLLLRFLQQDSLFAKHLHDLRVASPLSHCGNLQSVKSSVSADYESSGLSCRTERQTLSTNQRKARDSVNSNGKLAAHKLRSPKVELQVEDEPNVTPTRIVVLKPNVVKGQAAARSRFSHDILSNQATPDELPGIKFREKLSGEKPFTTIGGPSRYKSRESRAIAREITRQMKNSIASGSMNLSISRVKGYAADESSPDMSENESALESDATTVASLHSIDGGLRYRPSSSRSAESSVSREARKRLSERWKITHKSVDTGVVNRSSTLGEMLAIPDKELRLATDKITCQKVGHKEGFVGTEPLGISSRDGWKDVGTGSLRRSKSVPASSTATNSPKRVTRHEALCNDKYIIPKEVIQRGTNKAAKGNVNQRESPCAWKLKSHTQASNASSSAYSDLPNLSPGHFRQDEPQSSKIRNNLHEQQNREFTEKSAGLVIDTRLVSENVVCMETIEDVATHPICSDNKLSGHVPVECNSSAGKLYYLDSQEQIEPPKKGSNPPPQPMAETESPRSKNMEQPSPISVLETTFPDDRSSGSECFESLSADLQGLRMQLQLLKLESEAYEEGPMLVSSDEDEEASPGLVKERVIVEDSREMSYIIRVLVHSGINDSDPGTFISTWHSSERPVNPAVFEELEKKFYDHESWLRSDRRLLFDRINAALLLIYQQFVDPYAWIRPTTKSCSGWIRSSLQDEVHNLLTTQDRKLFMGGADKVLESESQWLDLGGDIDVIGREIARLLIDELVEQAVEM